MLEGLLNQIGGTERIAQLAGQLGISEEQVRTGVAALGQAHAEPGDTVQAAAATTGLDQSTLSQLASGIGGEGMLGRISGMIDRDGDGNPLNDITGLAGKLFG